MFGPQFLQAGVNVIGQVGSYIAASRKAKSDRQWQDYNNRMTRISEAMNQNSITTNDNMRAERKHAQLQQIQKSKLATRASAEVAAAAMGTVGNSVNAVLFDINRNAANANKAIEKDDDMQDVGSNHQRLQSAMQLATNLDLRTITGPSVGSMLIGVGSALAKTLKE